MIKERVVIIELSSRDILGAIKYWYANCDDAPNDGEVMSAQIAEDRKGEVVARLRMVPMIDDDEETG